jgi:hypothetical protein
VANGRSSDFGHSIQGDVRLQMTGLPKVFVGAALLLLGMLGPATAAPKRVLLLESFGRDFTPFSEFSGSFRSDLVQQSPETVEFFEVSLEMARFSEVDQQGPFADYLSALLAQHPMDLVVPIGIPAASFVQQYRQRLFPATPVLFSALEVRLLHGPVLAATDAVVGMKIELRLLIENILSVLPETKNIAVVIGDSPLERFWLGEMRREFQPFTNRVSLSYFNHLSYAAMLEGAAALPPHSAILFPLLHTDATGVTYDGAQALSDIRAVADAPMFGVYTSQLGHGIVGGRLISPADLSLSAARVAVRILHGETPGDITTEPLEAGPPMYDWEELQRWNISEQSLPSGSDVLFREASLWEKYRAQISLVAAVVLIEGALILWLLSERRTRAAAQAELHRRLLEIAHLNRNADAGAFHVDRPRTQPTLGSNFE